jgi:hypothetical protein
MYKGMLGKEPAPFTYGGEQYILWVAQEGLIRKTNVVKVAVRDRATGQYRFVNSLKPTDFSGEAPGRMTALIAKANELVQKTKPQENRKTIPAALATLRAELRAAEDAVVADIRANACKALNAGCFAADTKLWTPSGYKAVQDFVAGDMLYSRDEWDADAPVEVKLVEEVFVRYAGILALHAGGQVIRTTGEHPFFEKNRGWTACQELRAGDTIRTEDGWVAVEEVWDTGDWEVVYNVRVGDHHTYFVGDEGWGWSLWAHNTYSITVQNVSGGVVYTVTNLDTNYSGQWHAPKASETNKTKAKLAADLDETNNKIGLNLQNSVTAFANQWNTMGITEEGKISDGRANAIRAKLAIVVDLYTRSGVSHGDVQTLYQYVMSGNTMIHMPILREAELAVLGLTANQYADMKTEAGECFEVIHTQRAAAKGDYIHREMKRTYDGHGYVVYGNGVDIFHTATGTWYEVMKAGSWEQHSGGDFSAKTWRVLSY